MEERTRSIILEEPRNQQYQSFPSDYLLGYFTWRWCSSSHNNGTRVAVGAVKRVSRTGGKNTGRVLYRGSSRFRSHCLQPPQRSRRGYWRSG